MGGLEKGSRYASSSLNQRLTFSSSIAEKNAEASVVHLQNLEFTLDGGFWVMTEMILELIQAHLHSELLVLDELLILTQPLHGIGAVVAWSQSKYLAFNGLLMFTRAAEEDMDADCRIWTQDRSVQVHNDWIFVKFCAGRHICDLASDNNRSKTGEKVDLEMSDQVDPQGLHQSSALPPDASTGSTASWPYLV
jgi:hypothetical protein